MNFVARRVPALVFSLALLFPAWATAEAQSLRVPYVSLSPTAGPLWIAYEAGFFKRNNVSTELLYIPGGSTIIQAIISGDVKIANMAPPSAIGAWAKGFDLVLIASGVDQLLETVVTGSSIKSPADLKNKKIRNRQLLRSPEESRAGENQGGPQVMSCGIDICNEITG